MDKLTKLISDILNIDADKIIDDLSIKEVPSWDSLKHIELIVAIEQDFNIQLSFDEIASMQSVRKIKEVIDKKIIG